ncbi:MAG: gliding motility-associated C-terminal domain-containing protein, partial [Bacteroidales bacterium]
LSVINKPWEFGAACDFDTLSVYLGGRHHSWDLPNFLLDYLYRFEWEADDYCQGSAVHFIPHFVPTPDSVEWFFDEFAPGNYSNELSPTYTFQNAGIHEVEVDIWYPTGRFEHTSREIEIYPTPKPDLGPDIVICEGTSITLNANCIADLYSWSTSQFGSPEITVTDSGTYWVRASFFETGCTGSDTIHVGFYPPILIDESSLVVTPTSCGGATGSVTGLAIQGADPLQYLWEDLSGNDYGTGIDVFNLPAGQYVLTVTDGNGCETSSSAYTITDAGNLQVTQVQTISPHCFRPDGQLIIIAFSPPGSILEYSIDNGNSYQTDSLFTALTAASYVVRVKDQYGCDGFYIDNPVILQDIPGPQVQQAIVSDETDFLQNGSIDITATGSTPQIFYSINNGSTWQTNNGTFNNLQAGSYICVVKDENDCDTTFTIEIQNIILTYLHAITGPGGHCLGNTAMVPVNVDNFNSVATFHLKLSYNADNLQCEGFTNVHLQLVDSLTGWVDQAAGVINLAWNSQSPVTFTQPETVAELVFTTKNPGQGELAWYTGTTESYFTNIQGSVIPAEFHTGEVTIYDPPSVILSASKTVCEGQAVSFMSIASGNQPPFTFQWTYPDGTITTSDPFFFNVNQSQAGDYILQATDQVGCTDQKSINLVVSENPVAAFHGTDTLTVQAGYLLEAGAGLASYLWNTGDTAESIIIETEGMYKVQLESPAGCTGVDSIYILLKTEEIPSYHIYFPNAFTPDGDGLNDTFKAFATGDYITKFNMQIYDRWGGLIFNSDDISIGWDGKKNGNPCPGGVYAYKIIFSIDGVQGNQERVGTVALIR